MIWLNQRNFCWFNHIIFYEQQNIQSIQEMFWFILPNKQFNWFNKAFGWIKKIFGLINKKFVDVT